MMGHTDIKASAKAYATSIRDWFDQYSKVVSPDSAGDWPGSRAAECNKRMLGLMAQHINSRADPRLFDLIGHYITAENAITDCLANATEMDALHALAAVDDLSAEMDRLVAVMRAEAEERAASLEGAG